MENKNCKAPERSLRGLFASLRRAYSEWRRGVAPAADSGMSGDRARCNCLTAYPDGRIEWHDDALRSRLKHELCDEEGRMVGSSTIPAAIFRHRKAWTMNG